MIFGLETDPLPENWTPLEAVAVVKCLDEEGSPRLTISVTKSLNSWEALGMLVAAADTSRESLREGFEEEE